MSKFNIVIGTKGQLIKMAPVMLEMDKRDIDYSFVNVAQHGKILNEIIDLFNLKEPDFILKHREKDIAKIADGAIWSLNFLNKSLLSKKVLGDKNDVIIVHGDAFPALLGTMIGKLKNRKLIHIEAGERTYNLFNPFPEEIIRILVDKFSDVLFASSNHSYENLLHYTNKKKVYNLKVNTIYDSIQIALKSNIDLDLPDDYILVSIHRFENIYSQERMKLLIKLLEEVSKKNKIVFPVHESTKQRLLKYNYWRILASNENMLLLPLQNYFNFIHLINQCDFLITDGGGPQEESYYLNKPCLLFREHTERDYYKNCYLSEFDMHKLEYFIKNYHEFMTSQKFEHIRSPSKQITEISCKMVNFNE